MTYFLFNYSLCSVRLNLMYDVHLVNYNNTAYLPGTEIAAFFWDTNKLRAMVSEDGMKTCEVSNLSNTCGCLQLSWKSNK